MLREKVELDPDIEHCCTEMLFYCVIKIAIWFDYKLIYIHSKEGEKITLYKIFSVFSLSINKLVK